MAEDAFGKITRALRRETDIRKLDKVVIACATREQALAAVLVVQRGVDSPPSALPAATFLEEAIPSLTAATKVLNSSSVQQARGTT